MAKTYSSATPRTDRAQGGAQGGAGPRLHYAWVVVAVTFLTSVITAGTLGGGTVGLLRFRPHFS